MAKNIVVCCDGTGDQFSSLPSNVVMMFEMARKDATQTCYYAPGVGTSRVNNTWWQPGRQARRVFRGATGLGVRGRMEAAYTFLMDYYEEGDKIYLFGFSRGAFTVRALSGMLYKCGLLAPELKDMVPYASETYSRHGNTELAAEFKRVFSRRCPVHFIGVWDTVESLAFNGAAFFDAELNPEVAHGYQALALDERRRKFPPKIWEPRENIEQVWFAGAHADVGGSYEQTELSNNTLRWLGEKAVKHGMALDTAALGALQSDPLGPQHESDHGGWPLLGTKVRTIAPGSKVHVSVKERLGKRVEVIAGDAGKASHRVYRPRAKMPHRKRFDPDQMEFVE